jgi:hypothetical protein
MSITKSKLEKSNHYLSSNPVIVKVVKYVSTKY